MGLDLGGVFFNSPFAFRFAGTRDVVGVGAGAREDCLELSRDIGSATGGAGIDCREVFRGFAEGVGAGFGTGSALFDRMLEKAIGSAGLLGVYHQHIISLILEH